jgi:hypothetical protein
MLHRVIQKILRRQQLKYRRIVENARRLQLALTRLTQKPQKQSLAAMLLKKLHVLVPLKQKNATKPNHALPKSNLINRAILWPEIY